MPKGFVWIVGAGPGDANLLTLKAKECLEQADVVVYDRLITPSILSFANPNAELIYVGKKPDSTNKISQQDINDLLVVKAREGKNVVRLKNGDPFVFGRGSEEAEALANAGIPFEIVPGLSSVFTVPAYAGIPLTDRRYSSNFVVCTGHCAEGKSVSFKQMAASDTVVALMAVGELPRVVAGLIEGGKDPKTPAALVEWGTTPNQRTIVAQLFQLPDLARFHNVQPPAVLIVGEVVKLREKIAWYEHKPLFGKRILVTDAKKQQKSLASKLEGLGAEVIFLPITKTIPAEDEPSLVNALERVLQGSYSWVIFTSEQGVRIFFELAWERDIDTRAFASVKFAVGNQATGEALRQWGIRFDAMLLDRNESLTKLLTNQRISSTSNALFLETLPIRALLWRGHGTDETLAQRLRLKGFLVDEVCAYRIVPNKLPRGYLSVLLKDPIHIIVFTKPPDVQAFFVTLGEERAIRILKSADVIVFDAETEKAIRQKGLNISPVNRKLLMKWGLSHSQ